MGWGEGLLKPVEGHPAPLFHDLNSNASKKKEQTHVTAEISPTTSTVDLFERDNKETLLVKEEETSDAEVFGEVEIFNP